MPYAKKLSSLQTLRIVENVLDIGLLEIAQSDDEWVVSSGFRRMLGLDGAASSGGSYGEIAGALHASDRKIFDGDIALAFSGVIPPDRVHRVPTAVGTIRYVSLKFEALHAPNGKVQRLLGVAHEVTGEYVLRQALALREQRAMMLMSALGIHGIWRSNPFGTVRELFATYELKRIVPLTGLTWDTAVHSDDGPSIRAALAKAIGFGEAFVIPMRIVVENDFVGLYLNKGFPIRDQDGTIIEWCGVLLPEKEAVRGEGLGVPLEAGEAAKHATGQIISAACGAVGWTHEVFAARSGLSHTTVRRLQATQGPLLGAFKQNTLQAALSALMTTGLRLSLSNEQKLSILYKPD